jgi:tRNA threonylcarbamoyladenosine biosynthesis protein TsaE
MQYSWNTASPEETIALAEKIGAKLRAGDVIAYRGDLGAGKTTFTRGLAAGMGIKELVTSPTFALVHEYGGEPPLAGASQCSKAAKVGKRPSLIHFDMYRITSGEDLDTTGFYDYMDDDAVLAVEWSENIDDDLPDDCIRITIDRISDDERQLTVETCDGDDRFEDIGN